MSDTDPNGDQPNGDLPNGDLPIAPDPWEQPPVRTRRPWWFWLATGFGGIILFLSAAFVTLYYYFEPNLVLTTDRLGEPNRTPSITLTDQDGKVFATRGAAFGYRVKVEEMPPYLPAAFIVTEDRRFYSHSGVDFRGLVRALFTNWQAGGVVQGGSTITQQLAKNTFLKPERTWSRKFEEMFLAFWLERHYSKQEILTLYLNRIYLGAGAYGVDAAARNYFGKSVRDVTLAEAAMLAALTRAPSRYSPDANLQVAQTRAKMVIDLLLADGQISEEDANKAKAKPAKPVLKDDVESANYFADFVVDQLPKDIIRTKDLIVRTTIDTKLQAVAQKNMTAILDREGKNRAVTQGALIAMEPGGAIRSLVGGKDYAASTFNRAYQARRQPGSSFKPFVYLAALEHGLSPDDIRDDAPYENRGWSPDNYDGSYLGPITLREALAKSVNTVAVRVADEVGRRNIIAVAQRLGITSPLEPNRSLPLGTSEVTLYEMTGAFGAFANHGNRVYPYVILDVKTADGTILFQHRPAPPVAVMNEQSLEQMNQMLFEVIQTGTGQRADLDPRPAAAKTGTSQDWHDAWFVGFTADYVTGVWVGNDDNSPINRVVGGSIPASIWKAYMLAAHKNIPIHSLPGVDAYGSGDVTAEAPSTDGNQDQPWVDRDGNSQSRNPRDNRDRGVIEDFFDSLFGHHDPGTSAPPPPPEAPDVSPQADTSDSTDTEDSQASEPDPSTDVAGAPPPPRHNAPPPAPPHPPAAASTGPYRQPEPDASQPSPF